MDANVSSPAEQVESNSESTVCSPMVSNSQTLEMYTRAFKQVLENPQLSSYENFNELMNEFGFVEAEIIHIVSTIAKLFADLDRQVAKALVSLQSDEYAEVLKLVKTNMQYMFDRVPRLGTIIDVAKNYR